MESFIGEMDAEEMTYLWRGNGMKNTKQIIVTGIKWDAPKSANLPKRVVIDVNEDNEYLLEDIEYYADNLSNYLSDTYEYCHNGFTVKCC